MSWAQICPRNPPFLATQNAKDYFLYVKIIFFNFALRILKSFFLYDEMFFEFCLMQPPFPTAQNSKMGLNSYFLYAKIIFDFVLD